MNNIIECNICMEQFNEKEKLPRVLRCGHTFCSFCLKELIRTRIQINEQTEYLECPLDKYIGHNNLNIEEIPINRYLSIIF